MRDFTHLVGLAVKLQWGVAEVPPVSYRRQLVRYMVLVLVLVALAAGTTTATRWMPWSPLDSCLFCGGSTVATSTAPPELARTAASTGTLSGRLGHSVTQAQIDLAPSSLPTEMSALAPDRPSSRAEASDDWQPWSHAAAQRGGSNNNASAVLSGLSRLSSATISGGGSAVRPSVETRQINAASEHADQPTPAVDAPAPPAPPSAAPTPRGPGATTITTSLPPGPGGFSPSAPTAAALTPNPTGTFHEQDNPPPTPFVPPPPVGALNANDPSGTLPVNGSSTPSPTPEPASMLLLATGVAAVFGELRRRRVM